MTEVVYNACFGGFSLSYEATMELARRKGIKLYPTPSEIDESQGRGLEDAMIVHYFKVPPEKYRALEAEIRENGESYKRLNDKDWYFSNRDIERDDPDLIALVKEWGERASGSHANLQVVEIPDDVEWVIDEYDGSETVEEAHRSWP